MHIKELWHAIKQKQRINAFDITVFLRQLATLLTAGIPILHCCDMLEKSQFKIAMRILIHSIKRELLAGKNVYASLRMHEHYFNPVTCQLIRIGEHTGKLDITLQMIADEHEKQLAFNKRIKQALFYPCIICITSLVVTLCMFLFVIPRFAELFADTHVELPALTKWLFFFSAQLNQHLLLLFFPVLLILPLFFTNEKSRALKQACLRKLTKLPLLHQFLQKMLLAKFARNLAMMFAAGIPILHALKLVTHSESNSAFNQAILQLRHQLSSGLQLHAAMQTLPYFPNLMIQMVKMGEESGSLDLLLQKVAGFFESDIDHLINQFSHLLEPLIMLVQGVLIGGLIIGMYLPIFKLGSII